MHRTPLPHGPPHPSGSTLTRELDPSLSEGERCSTVPFVSSAHSISNLYAPESPSEPGKRGSRGRTDDDREGVGARARGAPSRPLVLRRESRPSRKGRAAGAPSPRELARSADSEGWRCRDVCARIHCREGGSPPGPGDRTPSRLPTAKELRAALAVRSTDLPRRAPVSKEVEWRAIYSDGRHRSMP